MKKALFFTFSILFSINFLLAQPNETFPTKASISGRVFKVSNNPLEDKTDQFDISGMGQVNFTTSNTADGTTNSYSHSLSVTIALVPANKTVKSNFQIHFYSPSQDVQQSANYNDGVLNIYYPMSLFDAIRTKLEQSIAARKKVTVKVIQKPNGYREGSLIL